MVQQHFMLLEPCTVAENIVYGREPRKKGLFFDRETAVPYHGGAVREVRPAHRSEAAGEGLPCGPAAAGEILKVLYQDADIIIFDEPSAVLTPQEVNELLATMRKLAAMGKSITSSTHKLHEVRR